jgi:fumarate hydratase subunit beta
MSTQTVTLSSPLTETAIAQLHAGDQVRIEGTLYVARDAAHKRMVAALAAGEALPFDPTGQIIYYMGPSPARPGRPIGSAGPTTSYRMDPYTEDLLRAGIKGLIGKGQRGEVVRRALAKHKAVYFVAIGGAAALIAQSIRQAQVIAYPELGPEAVRQLTVAGFPAIVGHDMYGQDVYVVGRELYRPKGRSGPGG